MCLEWASHVACRIANSGVCSYYHMMVYVAELGYSLSARLLGHVHARAHKEPRFQGSVYDLIDHLLLCENPLGTVLAIQLVHEPRRVVHD